MRARDLKYLYLLLVFPPLAYYLFMKLLSTVTTFNTTLTLFGTLTWPFSLLLTFISYSTYLIYPLTLTWQIIQWIWAFRDVPVFVLHCVVCVMIFGLFERTYANKPYGINDNRLMEYLKEVAFRQERIQSSVNNDSDDVEATDTEKKQGQNADNNPLKAKTKEEVLASKIDTLLPYFKIYTLWFMGGYVLVFLMDVFPTRYIHVTPYRILFGLFHFLTIGDSLQKMEQARYAAQNNVENNGEAPRVQQRMPRRERRRARSVARRAENAFVANDGVNNAAVAVPEPPPAPAPAPRPQVELPTYFGDRLYPLIIASVAIVDLAIVPQSALLVRKLLSHFL